jgi:hypothetical protein
MHWGDFVFGKRALAAGTPAGKQGVRVQQL